MHPLKFFIFLHLLVSFFCFGQSNRPDSAKIYQITIADGSELVGVIIEESLDTLLFKTLSGLETAIPRAVIKQMSEMSGKWSQDVFIINDPNSTRVLLSPSGECLQKGKGYFSLYKLVFPSVVYGLSDFITLYGGMTIFPGTDQQLYYFSPKIKLVSSEQFKLSLGTLYIHTKENDIGIGWMVGTYGSKDASLTGGIGLGTSRRGAYGKPFGMFGGEVRVSNNAKLVTENWILPDFDGAFLSFGIRFFGEQFAMDIALATYSEFTLGRFPFVPWIGIVRNF